MRHRLGPAAPFCGGLAAAIAVSGALDLPAPSALLLAFGFAAAAFSIHGASREARPGAPGAAWRPRILLLAALAGLAAGGGLCALVARGPRLGVRAGDVRAYRAVALEDSMALSRGGRRHRLALSSVSRSGIAISAHASGSVLLFSSAERRTYWGQEVEVQGRLEPLPPASRDDFLCRVGLSGLEPQGVGSPLMRARTAIRASLEARVDQMGRPVSDLFLAIFLGDRSGISEELGGLFRDSGSLHVLALSGMHLMIVYALARAAARAAPVAAVRRVAPLLLTGAYLFVTGPLPSLVRAAAMLAASRAASALDRKATGVDVLSAAGSAILILEPRMLFDLSFQLSFAAVLGMVTFGEAIADRLAPAVPRFLLLPLSATVGAQAAVAPILLAANGIFQPVGVASALVVAPCATLFLGVGLAELSLPLWLPAWVHAALGSVLWGIYQALEAVLGFFARFPPSRSWAVAALLWIVPATALAPAALRHRVGRA